MKRLLVLLITPLLFVACNPGTVYKKYVDLENNKWEKDNKITFDVDIEETDIYYNVEFAFRHTSYYKWANVMVNLTSVYPSGEKRTRDYNFFVRDSDGSFKGEGAGDIWDNYFSLITKAKFPDKGKYSFTIENIMPVTATDDVMQLGIIVTKSHE